MTQNFDRWLAERLEEELPDPIAIPADPSAARYRASPVVRRGLPRFVRALVPSVAAQLVLAGTGVAVAVAAGAAATGHPPTSLIEAVGGASSATAPPQGSVAGAGATTADQGSGQSSPSKKSSQSAPILKKAVPAAAAPAATGNDDRKPDEHALSGPRPTESPEPPHSGDHAAQPWPSPSPEH
jgi:hypothetical protein